MSRFLKFLVAGLFGFAIDAGVLQAFHLQDISLYIGRVFSFGAAVVATWLINRSLAFSATAARRPTWREFRRYLMSSIGGLSINFLSFFVFITLVPQLQAVPLVPLAAAVLLGMLFNYAAYARYVFTGGDGGRR